MHIIEKDKFDFRSMYYTDRNQLSYMGPFDDSIVDILAHYIKGDPEQENSLSDKVMQVFFELAKNVVVYSAERLQLPENNIDQGIGSIIIRWTDEFYTFAVGNVVSREDATILQQKCEIINSLSIQERKDYLVSEKPLIQETKVDTNRGLLQVAILTEQKLDHIVTELDNDQCFFRVAVTVSE